MISDKTVYEVMQVVDVPYKHHSRLHSLKPVTFPRYESLTGYIKRLAISHCLIPRKLLVNEYMPHINKEHIKHGSSFYKYGAKTINGVQHDANLFTEVTEKLTKQNDLKYLTMLTWKNTMSRMAHTSSKSYLSWCPCCLEEMRKSDGVVYEPLEWTIKINGFCHFHNMYLESECPCCRKRQPIFSNSRIGCCYSCNAWLGKGFDSCNKLEGDYSKDWFVSYYIWVMVNNAKKMRRLACSQDLFALMLKRFADELSQGSINLLATTILGLNYKTVQQWASQRYLPRFDLFIHICLCLKKDPVSFFFDKEINPLTVNYQINIKFRKNKVSFYERVLTKKKIKEKLDHYYSAVDSFPYSLSQVSLELGVTVGYLVYHFEEESIFISDKYLYHRESISGEWKKSLAKRIRKIIFKFYTFRKSPTRNDVGDKLGSRAYFKSPTVREAYNETMNEITSGK